MAEDLKASGRLSVAIFASRVLGLLREVMFAALFGAGAIADAYLVAFRIPNLLRDLLAEGALSSAFVPTFTAANHHDGKEAAYRLGNLVLTAILLLTGTLTVLGLLFAEPVVIAISKGFGGDAAKVELAARLTRVMMPILALVSLGAVWMGMLNAQRRFGPPAVAPAVFNLVSMASGVAVWLLADDVYAGILVWSIGTLVAGIVQAGVQLPALWKLGYRPALRIRGLLAHPGVRRIAVLMGPAVLSVGAVQASVFINTRFAGSLGDGPVAQLSYAFRLFFLPLGMFGVALATVTTTSMSEAAAKQDPKALAARTADGVSAGWMLTSASAVGLFVLAEPIVALIYQHGQTSAAAASAIAVCLQGYVVGLVPYSLVKIVAPAFFTVDKPRIPLLASVTGVAVNVTFNALTYRILGAPGIALGTALGAMANLTVLRIAYGRVIAPLRLEARGKRMGALLVANAVMGAVVWGSAWAWQQWLRELGMDGLGLVVTGAWLLFTIGAGFGVLTAILRAMGYPGADLLWRLPGKIVGRLRGRRAAQ